MRAGSQTPLFDSDLEPAPAGLEPLYAGTALGELRLPSCGSCGSPLDLVQVVCDRCGRLDVRWSAVALHGTVHAATTVMRPSRRFVIGNLPYHVVDVDLASGHRLTMAATHRGGATPAIGDAVAVQFARVGTTAVPRAHVAQPGDDKERA